MADYRTARSQPWGQAKAQGANRQHVLIESGVITVATAMIDNANDEIGLFWVPAGFTVTGITFYATDLDGGTALVWDVGDSADEDRLLAAITTGQSAGSSTALAATGYQYQYASRTLIKAYVNTAAGTPAAGTISCHVEGFVDEGFSRTAQSTEVAA